MVFMSLVIALFANAVYEDPDLGARVIFKNGQIVCQGEKNTLMHQCHEFQKLYH